MKSTYYVRDARGNVMGTYEHTPDHSVNPPTVEFTCTERPIYGSSRVGMDVTKVVYTTETAPLLEGEAVRLLGNKQYEISNHLGNVLVVVSDIKMIIQDQGTITGYEAQIISATDYSPFSAALSICDSEWLAMRTLSERYECTFTPLVYGIGQFPRVEVGVALEGRTYSGGTYRFGFQAQEQEAELWEGAVNYKYRVEDPRLGRFFSVDPLNSKYPWNSCYAFSENVLISCRELEGLEKFYSTTGEFICQIGTSNEVRVVRESQRELLLTITGAVNEYTKPIEQGFKASLIDCALMISSACYESMNDAATAFSIDYNYDQSTGKYAEEQAAGIFMIQLQLGDNDQAKTLYVLGNKVEGTHDADGYGEGVNPGLSAFEGLNRVAVVHTHGQDDKYIDDEKFSDNDKYTNETGYWDNVMMDKNFSRKFQIPLYLATPSGVLKVFIPNGERDSPEITRGRSIEITIGTLPSHRAPSLTKPKPVHATKKK